MSKSNQNLLKFRERKDSLTDPLVNNNNNNDSPSSSSSQSIPSNGEPKRFLRQSGFNQVINEIIVGLCRKFLEFPIQKRIVFYFSVVILGGLIGDLAPGLASWMIPIKTEKSNYLNVFFVKLGWAWTIGLLTPFMIIVGKVIENRNKWIQTSDVIRIVIATICWFVSTSLFVHIENATGSCTAQTYRSRHACLKAGHRWHGFDISGHVFILLYSSLIIIEETKSMMGFENFGYLLDSRSQLRRKVHNRQDNHRDFYMKNLVAVRFLFVGLTFLTLLWDFMLIQTAFYYHNFLQKLLACAWAIFLWYLTYKCLYPSKFLGIFRSPIKPPSKLSNE